MIVAAALVENIHHIQENYRLTWCCHGNHQRLPGVSYTEPFCDHFYWKGRLANCTKQRIELITIVKISTGELCEAKNRTCNFCSDFHWKGHLGNGTKQRIDLIISFLLEQAIGNCTRQTI
jgi:hypothetical protein